MRVIDHHGPAAGKDAATALEQIFELLRLPAEAWTRWLELVAANDRAHVRGLQDVAATPEEIQRVRTADRAAQGIGPEEEAAAEEAAACLEVACEGRLHVAQLPHARTTALVDRLDPVLGGPGYQNLLVLSPDELNFFGQGDLVLALDQRFPEGWYGGALPERGYWGHQRARASEVRSFLEAHLEGLGE